MNFMKNLKCNNGNVIGPGDDNEDKNIAENFEENKILMKH